MIDDNDIDPGLPEPPPDDGPGLFGGPAPAAAPVAVAAPAKPYRVLARAYRPTRFDDLIGQDAMVRILRRAFELGRVAHAFMLTGVRGVGKTTSARIIARALNCIGADGNGGPTADPCGVCPNCVAILADRHPDVLEMDAASRTGIEDVREIIEATRFRPMQARMKVFIIDEVHMLSRNAFNALLKTLEEPPSQVTFIFATTELRRVPVTVLSRCQRFDLRRVSIGELTAHFARIAAKEGAAISADALALIARAADGSVRDGLSLLDQAIAQGPSAKAPGGGTEIGAEQVADMLGLADRGLVFDLLDAVMGGRADTALGITDQAHTRGADLGQMLADLLELIHTVSRLKSIPALRDNTELPEAERVRGAALADALSVPVLGRAWQMLLKGVAEVEAAPDRREAAEMVLIRLCHVADLPTPGELVRQLQAEGAGAVARPVAVPPLPGPAAADGALPAVSAGAERSPTSAGMAEGPRPDTVMSALPVAALGLAAAPAIVQLPVAEQPVAEQPATRLLDAQSLAAHSLDTESLDTQSLAAQSPGAQSLGAQSGVAQQPVAQPPATQPSVTLTPAALAPTTLAPATLPPITEPSAALSPGGDRPAIQAAVVQPSVVQPHVAPSSTTLTAAPSLSPSEPPASWTSGAHASGSHASAPPATPQPNVSTAAVTSVPVQGLSGGGALRARDHDTAPSGPVPAPAEPAASVSATVEPAPDASAVPPSLRSWREVVAFVNARRMATLHGNLMHCAHLVRFRPPVIELALEHGAPKDLSQLLAAVLREATGNRWSIVIVRDEPGEPTLAQQAGLVQADLDRDAESHPLVQAILAAFPGAVVGPVSDRSLDEYYALPPEQGGSLLAEDGPDEDGPDGEAPPDMEFAPEGAESVGLDDLAAADRG